MSTRRQTIAWLLAGCLGAAGCRERFVAWRVGPSCPISGGAAGQLAFGRSYELEVRRAPWGEPPTTATVRENDTALGQVSLACVTRTLAGRTWVVRAGGATVWDGVGEDAQRLGALDRDAEVVLVGTTPPRVVVAHDGQTRGFVDPYALAPRADEPTTLPDWLTAAFFLGGVGELARVFGDLRQPERQDQGVRGRVAALIAQLDQGGRREEAAAVVRLLDLDELQAEPYRPQACNVAFGGLPLAWDLAADLVDHCPDLPLLPDTWEVAVAAPGECPPETELLGQHAASVGTLWACHVPDAELVDEPNQASDELVYETRLEHLYLRDRRGRIADLLAELSWPRLPREGRWSFLGLHDAGLGACVEYQDVARGKTRSVLSCFPPPPAHATSTRLLLPLAGTTPAGTAWRKRWAVTRDRKSFVLCAGDAAALDQAWRLLPGEIRKLRAAPPACRVRDARPPATPAPHEG